MTATFSGLEFAKSLQERRSPGPPPPWVTHMRVIEENPIELVEPGRIITNWTPGVQFTMQDGYLQGGLIGAMADGGQSLAIISTLTEYEIWVTLDLHLRFIRPIKLGSSVRIEHAVANRSKTSAVVESTFTVDGNLAAKATGGWRRIEIGRAENFRSPAQ